MNKLNIISLLKICAFTVFIGRAYQFYFFGAPFRAFFWDESLLSPIVEGLFNTSWYNYASNAKVNSWIEALTKLCSGLLFIAALTSLFWDKIKFYRFKKIILSIGLFILLLLAICMVKDKNYDYFQFFELTLQFAAPLLLLLKSDLQNLKHKKTVFALKIAIALTFIPHGLFAMGIPHLPGHFIDMTISLLSVNENQATQFLFVAGLLDLILSLLIFVPKLSKYALIYMIIWGFLTALARPFSSFNQDFISASLHGSLFLMIYRLSHGIIPLIVLLMEKRKKTIKPSGL
ncbi:hypothetical protein OAA67_04015 [Winogradskyella sp.]|uniref:hypothetical protein n=1 Tax=uncultured Winogradskyella sp. TaxID=395353 RepID=UPI002372860E|nr:hypothetical protein [Winogradskyella sp.]|tara:strand:- start:2884 stop:3750 length:867 start_codon:yes stop_codon:yes gene_type:complete